MRAIALALGASLTWGLADFFGPLAGRRLGALRVLVYVAEIPRLDLGAIREDLEFAR